MKPESHILPTKLDRIQILSRSVPEQSFPPGFTIRPKPTDNLFLGLFPAAAAATHIAQLAQQLRARHGLRRKQLATDRFHVSLYSFTVLEADLEAVGRASAAAAASTPSFDVGFDRALSFAGRPGNRPFVLRDSGNNTGLMEFHQRLGATLGEFGFRYKGKPSFTPHVTLLYDEQGIAEEPIDPVSWKVGEFVLVHSLVGQSRYIKPARWPLRG